MAASTPYLPEPHVTKFINSRHMDQLCIGACFQINMDGNDGRSLLDEPLESAYTPPPAASPTSDTSSDTSDGRISEDQANDLLPVLRGMAGKVHPHIACSQRKKPASLSLASQSDEGPLSSNFSIPSPKSSSSLFRSKSVPANPSRPEYTMIPPPMRLDAWSETPANMYKVRSRNYMSNREKELSAGSVFELLCVDLVRVDKPLMTGLCSHPNERIQQALRREEETGLRLLPNFIYAVNLCVPGKHTYHWVAYFGLDDIDLITNTETPLGRVAYPFFFGDSDEYRDQRFKLIPRIVEGNVIVKKAVGSKPAILGRKIRQSYIRTDRFMEMIVDIASDRMAQRIVKLALGYIGSIKVDMMFVLEGIHEKELPERILGGCRLMNLDFKHKDGQRVVQPPHL